MYIHVVLASERTATREEGGATCEGSTNTRECQYKCECEYEYEYDPTSISTRHVSERRRIEMGRMEHCTRVRVIALWSRGYRVGDIQRRLAEKGKNVCKKSLCQLIKKSKATNSVADRTRVRKRKLADPHY